jgi:hypothetical protein
MIPRPPEDTRFALKDISQFISAKQLLKRGGLKAIDAVLAVVALQQSKLQSLKT